MIWNNHQPIIVNRLFLKPKIYYIIDIKLQKELQKIYETFYL